jgi:hypothetical protein
MQTHEAKNEKLELKVENQEFLGKMPSQTEDGQCPICNDRVIKLRGIREYLHIFQAFGFNYGLATCEGCKASSFPKPLHFSKHFQIGINFVAIFRVFSFGKS